MKTKDVGFKQLAAQYPKITEWLKKNGDCFYEALGFWPSDDPAMVLALVQMTKYFGGHFPMWKDAIASHRCDVLTAFISGEDIEQTELRTAIVLLLQSCGGLADKAALLERTIRSYQHRPPEHRPPGRPPSPRPR